VCVGVVRGREGCLSVCLRWGLEGAGVIISVVDCVLEIRAGLVRSGSLKSGLGGELRLVGRVVVWVNHAFEQARSGGL